MDQFSHDLTVALEETSLLDRARVSRWGQQRRRTRSTGNLPCAPQPTEDSSSPTDIAQGPPPALASALNNDGLDAQNIHLPPSDSDEKDDGVDPPRLPCKLNSSVRLLGTLESDSLNETFSPARFFKPNARRKRKLKRATMDYEISGCDLAKSPPTMFNNIVHPTAFTASSLQTTNTSGISAMRKRCLKSDSTNRSQLFFCGKRKRSNREHDHSSSMPRHHMTAAAAAAHHIIDDSYRMRPRSFSSTSKPHSDRLLPLNKGLLSKIERISQQQQKTDLASATTTTKLATIQTNLSATTLVDDDEEEEDEEAEEELLTDCALSAGNCEALSFAQITEENGILAGGGGGAGAIVENTIEAAVCFANAASQATVGKSVEIQQNTGNASQLTLLAQQQQQQQETTNFRNHRKNKSNSKSSNRHRLLQFTVDEHSMDCEELNDFTSSSLSSSDSEDERNARNDTDREGDDELTDWPGNESICGELKYDCKRKLTKRNTLPQIKSDPESLQMLEDDTVMTLTNNTGTAVPSLCSTPALVLSGSGGGGGGGGSSVELFNSNSTLNWPPAAAAVAINNIAEKANNRTTITSSPFSSSSTTTITTANATELSMPYQASEPINITVGKSIGFASFLHHHIPLTDDVNIPLTTKQIESEMSGETSTNPFLASPPCHANEVREIRAGCRRVKGDRPGFSIKTSVNERLARFLQDPRQLQIRLPDIEIYEHESLLNLATLYSLHYSLDNGCAVLNKTSNTTQSVNIDQHSLKSRLFLSDFKRRCYDNKKSAGLMPE